MNGTQKIVLASGLALGIMMIALIIVSHMTPDGTDEPTRVAVAETGLERSSVTEVARTSQLTERSVSETPSRRRIASRPAVSSEVPRRLRTTSAPARVVRVAPEVTLDGALPENASLDDLMSVLLLPDHRPNPQAIEALAAMNHDTVVERLLVRLGNGESPYDFAIITALGAVGSELAVTKLEELIESPNPKTRRAALDAMSESRGQRAQSALLTRLDVADASEKQLILKELGKFRSAEVSARLVQHLDSSDRSVRQAAARGLTELGDSTTLPAIRSRIADPDKYVRREIMNALGAIPHPQSRELLTDALLGDDDRGVRKNAALALAEVGTEETIPALTEIISGDDEWLADFARTALSRIESRN